MAFTTPRTWVAGELVTAALMNTYIRDNQIALKTPPQDLYNVNEGADYSTTSATFVDVDATNLSLTIATTGGAVEVKFVCNCVASAANSVYFDVVVDGATQAGNDGIVSEYLDRSAAPGRSISFSYITAALSAASHQFKIAWKVTGGTITMYAGAGTGSGDLHPQFSVREVN